MSLSHLDAAGQARMVDVSGKAVSERVAVAVGEVHMSAEAFALVLDASRAKGDVLTTAELAGVMAAKRTSDLVPLCHPVPLDRIAVEVEPVEEWPGIRVMATARATARTGVEMEAIVAVSIACCTVYDMVKSADRGARITEIRVLEKSGGVRGDWRADGPQGPEPEER
jgi:cyclic pyranopterin phosphate synthase